MTIGEAMPAHFFRLRCRRGLAAGCCCRPPESATQAKTLKAKTRTKDRLYLLVHRPDCNLISNPRESDGHLLVLDTEEPNDRFTDFLIQSQVAHLKSESPRTR
jgi:hypothetical protein